MNLECPVNMETLVIRFQEKLILIISHNTECQSAIILMCFITLIIKYRITVKTIAKHGIPMIHKPHMQTQIVVNGGVQKLDFINGFCRISPDITIASFTMAKK